MIDELKKKSASSALSAKSQNRAGSNLWKSVKSVGLEREKKIPKDYLLCLSLQKKCHVLKIGSLIASAGKYLTSLISLYPLWRLCPSFDLPNRFLSSCLPKFPASSTSLSTNLPYFSFGGTICWEAGIPNTSCMIYIMAPANFHNPNSFNSFCKTPRRSHPAQSGVDLWWSANLRA